MHDENSRRVARLFSIDRNSLIEALSTKHASGRKRGGHSKCLLVGPHPFLGLPLQNGAQVFNGLDISIVERGAVDRER
jgi:hypothetical protein